MGADAAPGRRELEELRQAGLERLGRGEAVEPVLRDGNRVLVRQIQPADRGLLDEGFQRLSPTSRYRRFLSALDRLSSEELTYLTELDHSDHEALIAIEPGGGGGVGVARFVRAEPGGTAAEVAVTVVDDWQGRGLGTLLLHALAQRARGLGVRRFTGLVLSDNEEMLDVLATLGEVEVLDREAGTVDFQIELPELGEGSPAALMRLLREVASGAAWSRLRARAG